MAAAPLMIPGVPVPADLPAQVAASLAEDTRGGDLPAALISSEKSGRATVITREVAIVCGVPYVEAVFRQVDARVTFDWHVAEGAAVEADQVLFTVDGPARALLTAERTALNFLQLLSGTATAAHDYAALLAGTRCRLLDTRKTIPGLRTAQQYAVRVGVALNAKAKRPLKIEASGGITLETIREIAQTGVDFISVGSVTKHVRAVDLSMRFEWHG